MWDLCSRLAGGATKLALSGTGNELRDWVEIQDVVNLISQASNIEEADFIRLNGGSGIETSVANVAASLVAEWGREVEIEFVGGERAGDPFSLVAAPGLMADRGFVWQIPLSLGVPRYVRWFRDAHT